MSRVKKQYTSNDKQNYNRFILANNIDPEKLPYPKYKKIIEVNNWMFIEYALETGNKIRLPHGFGDLAVNKKMLKRYKTIPGSDKKYVNLRIDWQKTKIEGKRIFHTNEHTDGFNYKWYWNNKTAKIYMSGLYIFRPCRYASRAIAKYIKKPNSDYSQMYLEWTKK